MTRKPILRGKLRLNRPFNQNFIMGCILFCLPGIYLALTGLGAGGGQPSSQHVASLTNSILYGLYTLFGWCAGTFLNYFKPKITICIGALGYPFYVGSLWYYDRIGHQGFPLFAGAFLGFTAALLWTSSGFIQFAYAEERDKAKYITIQWVLTSLGSTFGALIAFCVNVNKTEVSGVSAPVYIVFIVIMCFAMIMTLLLIVDPKDVIRDDGRHIAIFKEPNMKDEIAGVLAVMTDPKIVILLPAMFVGEMCLALVSSINAYYFNLRTRTLNNLLFQVIMIPAPICLALIMDNPRIASRRTKGLLGAVSMGIITLAATGGLLGWVIQNDVNRNNASPGVDWSDSAFAAGFILYLLFGIVYACFQIAVQWTLGSLTNDPVLCARYSGAFKGTVSFGMCISFTIDSQNVSYRNQIIIQLVLYVVGLASLFYVIAVYVTETNYFTEANVIVPASVEEKAVILGAVPTQAIEHEKEKERMASEGAKHVAAGGNQVAV
ncbi:putative membrane transporter protein [Coleophoma crateriformis]|uniref:Putative membrane transporter protein n=1 Tax=Coleophoma crateriformis TaxID=565419 RepID=A0A3D8SXG0_9HELO|nr:putative membrane transporter protein [Coleophoma crateriformis]